MANKKNYKHVYFDFWYLYYSKLEMYHRPKIIRNGILDLGKKIQMMQGRVAISLLNVLLWSSEKYHFQK